MDCAYCSQEPNCPGIHDCTRSPQMTESIREHIAQLIRDYANQQIAIVVNATIPKNPLTSDGQADTILSLLEITVLDADQSLPITPYPAVPAMEWNCKIAYEEAQQDMLAQGWVKVIPNKGAVKEPVPYTNKQAQTMERNRGSLLGRYER